MYRVRFAAFMLFVCLATGSVVAGECPVCGSGKGRQPGDPATASQIQSEHWQKWHFFCHHCDDGKAIALECYHLMHAIIADNKNLKAEAEKQKAIMENRIETMRGDLKTQEQGLAQLKNTNADVAQIRDRTERKVKEMHKQLDKMQETMNKIERERQRPEWREDYYDYWFEYLKKEMVTMSIPMPDKPLPTRLPDFRFRNSYSYWYGFGWDDMIVAARSNLERKKKAAEGSAAGGDAAAVAGGDAAVPGAAPAGGAANKRPIKRYILNNGTEIRTRLAVENGDDVTIKNEDTGKLMTIKKADIKAVGEE